VLLRRPVSCWIIARLSEGILAKAGLQWDDVRLLLAVASQGSFAKAARQSGVSQLMNAEMRHEPRLRAVADAIGVLFRRERRDLMGEAVRPSQSNSLSAEERPTVG
jgi:hypothetical protein